ncbi:hypothetical protein C2845_PM15G09770 [Panicum miliaceum]|uniref:Uncharacterized protein n=1 Tax=Panicum miliaceum TaxID=4540 RepID=A0A3L6Q7U4_PANMI|nr:hypothetical protein C2845_PM15G09770 [Panicum miliaceum]
MPERHTLSRSHPEAMQAPPPVARAADGRSAAAARGAWYRWSVVVCGSREKSHGTVNAVSSETLAISRRRRLSAAAARNIHAHAPAALAHSALLHRGSASNIWCARLSLAPSTHALTPS